MIPALLALFLLPALPVMAGTPPAEVPSEVLVAPGDTLAALAAKHLGSEEAAGELRALNGLAPGAEPAAGSRLKLPGPDRAKLTARLAGIQGETGAHVKKARELLSQARYSEGLALLPPAAEPGPTRFTVEVEKSGLTTVTVRQGPPIAVEASGTEQRVEKGQFVQIRKGEAAPKPQPLLQPPSLAEPAADAKLEAAATGELLGPVAFRWSAVEGAEQYEVVVSEDREGRAVVARVDATAASAQLTTGLKAGSYFWRVVAKGGGREATSLVHGFRLVPAPPRLEVQKPRWK